MGFNCTSPEVSEMGSDIAKTLPKMLCCTFISDFTVSILPQTWVQLWTASGTGGFELEITNWDWLRLLSILDNSLNQSRSCWCVRADHQMSVPVAHAFRSVPGAHAFRSVQGAHAVRSRAHSVPGAKGVRSRARSIPWANRVRPRARSIPWAHRVRSRARSVPWAHRVRSRARSVPWAHRVRSIARSVPWAHRVRSRACSSPWAHSAPWAHRTPSVLGSHRARSVPGAHRARTRALTRARSVPGAHRVRFIPGANAVCSVPGAHAVRSVPGAYAFHSVLGAHRVRSVLGAHAVRPRARSVPGAQRAHSRARSNPGAHRARSFFVFSLALNGGGRFLYPSSPLSSLLCSLVSWETLSALLSKLKYYGLTGLLMQLTLSKLGFWGTWLPWRNVRSRLHDGAWERWRIVCLAALSVEDIDIYLFGTMITGILLIGLGFALGYRRIQKTGTAVQSPTRLPVWLKLWEERSALRLRL